MKTYQLSNGVSIPKIAFGTWQIPDGEEAHRAVLYALEAGYRHIDTAQIYGNEASVGQAIADSSVAREDIFLTTKVWNDKIGVEDTLASVEGSMTKLGVDYLDLLLIHWPNPKAIRDGIGWKERNAKFGKPWKTCIVQVRSRLSGCLTLWNITWKACLKRLKSHPWSTRLCWHQELLSQN